jgi:hypothetical protein
MLGSPPTRREVGSAALSPPRSEPHGIHEHILPSPPLRLPQPGGPGSLIHIPQEQGSPTAPPWPCVCPTSPHIIASHIHSSHMHNKYIRPPLVQAHTADYSPSRVVQAAAQVLLPERSHARPPPSPSLLYPLCRASPRPTLRTCTPSWCWTTRACCLHNPAIHAYGTWRTHAHHESGRSLESRLWCGGPYPAGDGVWC